MHLFQGGLESPVARSAFILNGSTSREFDGSLSDRGWVSLETSLLAISGGALTTDDFRNGNYRREIELPGFDRVVDAYVVQNGGTAMLAIPGATQFLDFSDVLSAEGHARQYEGLMPLVQAFIQYVNTNPSVTEVVIAGHSLGAALVEIMSRTDTALIAKPFTMVAFGSPGTSISADQPVIGELLNIRHVGDPVVEEGDRLGFVRGGLDFQMTPPEVLGSGEHRMTLYAENIYAVTESPIGQFILGGEELVLDSNYSHTLAADTGEAIFGKGGNDTITGNDLNDRFDGGSGNDQIIGAGGNDQLVGGAGSDVLDGGLGDDTFYWGALRSGHDSFVGDGAGVDTLVVQSPGVTSATQMEFFVDDGEIFMGIAGETSLGSVAMGSDAEGERFVDRISIRDEFGNEVGSIAPPDIMASLVRTTSPTISIESGEEMDADELWQLGRGVDDDLTWLYFRDQNGDPLSGTLTCTVGFWTSADNGATWTFAERGPIPAGNLNAIQGDDFDRISFVAGSPGVSDTIGCAALVAGQFTPWGDMLMTSTPELAIG